MSLDLEIDRAELPPQLKNILHELLYKIEDGQKEEEELQNCDKCAMYVPTRKQSKL